MGEPGRARVPRAPSPRDTPYALTVGTGVLSANDADTADPAFEDFLRSDAVVLAPPARAYLAGLSQAGPGELPLRRRHEAAMRAVFAVGGKAADLLAADTGPLPDDIGWIDLLDVAALEDFLTVTEPDPLR